MLHTFDPYAIQLTNTFGIRWYGLSYLVGFVSAYYLIVWLVRRNLSTIPLKVVSDFVFMVAIGTVVGGRLGYCIFYSPDLFTRVNSKFPFWGVLAVNEGGMASHGGIVGIIVAAVLFARKHDFSPRHAIDLCALTGPIGIFFGRLANFVNGELVGRPCETIHAWCVKFPQDILLWPGHETARLAELTPVVAEVGVKPETWNLWIKEFTFKREVWASLDSVLYRIIEAIQNGNAIVASHLSSILTLRHPSQLYEALLEGLFLFVFLLFIWAKPRKPGIITGAFLTVYSIVRIIGEQFRMPDIQIGYQALGLTRGQWLSIAMFAIGLIFLIIFSRSKSEAIGGWRQSR